MGLKQAALAAVSSDVFVPLWRPLTSNLVIVFMLHRFADPERGITGASIPALRANLEYLRRHRCNVVPLQDLLAPPTGRTKRGPTIVFTVDDGYADFARVGGPIFAAYDCPVTVFLVSGALDSRSWYWWNRVEFALHQSKRSNVQLDLTGRTMSWAWQNEDERHHAVLAITAALKLVRNDEKEHALSSLASRLDVDIPAEPTSRYAAMSWNDVRACAARGATFAPHTVTHPILPHVPDARSEWELLESWRRLRAECPTGSLPVFSYPNGAYSPREVDILESSELVAAVTTEQRYASRDAFHSANRDIRYAVPRFGYVDDPYWFSQIVTGLERLKMSMRHGLDGWNARG